MVCNTMRIFKNIIKIFFHLTIDLFIFMPHENRWMTRYNLSSRKVTKKALPRQNVNKTILLYMLNKAILKNGEGPGDEVRLWR